MSRGPLITPHEEQQTPSSRAECCNQQKRRQSISEIFATACDVNPPAPPLRKNHVDRTLISLHPAPELAESFSQHALDSLSPNPKPQTPNPKPQTLNPKPARHPSRRALVERSVRPCEGAPGGRAGLQAGLPQLSLSPPTPVRISWSFVDFFQDLPKKPLTKEYTLVHTKDPSYESGYIP